MDPATIIFLIQTGARITELAMQMKANAQLADDELLAHAAQVDEETRARVAAFLARVNAAPAT